MHNTSPDGRADRVADAVRARARGRPGGGAACSARSCGCHRSWCCSGWGSVQARSVHLIPTPCLASNYRRGLGRTGGNRLEERLNPTPADQPVRSRRVARPNGHSFSSAIDQHGVVVLTRRSRPALRAWFWDRGLRVGRSTARLLGNASQAKAREFGRPGNALFDGRIQARSIIRRGKPYGSQLTAHHDTYRRAHTVSKSSRASRPPSGTPDP